MFDMDENYKEALTVLFDGFMKLGLCIWNTIKQSLVDAGHFAWKHPIFVIILIGMFLYSLVTTINARVERDSYNQTNYYLEQSIDSLKILLDKLLT